MYIVAVCLYAAGQSENRPFRLRGSDQDILASSTTGAAKSTDEGSHALDVSPDTIEQQSNKAEEKEEKTEAFKEEEKSAAKEFVAAPAPEPAAALTEEKTPAVEEVVPAPEPDHKPDAPSAPAASPQGTSGSKICERDVPVNLADTTSWPTPYTPSYFEKEPIDSKEAVLLSQGGPFGNTLIIAIFHAMDIGYDHRCPVYVTKDCNWIWDKLTPWFFGENYVRDDDFWRAMILSFNVHILEDSTPETLDAVGKTWHKLGSQSGYQARSKELGAVQLRNRRDTIFRMLFQQSRSEGKGNVCTNIISSEMNKLGAKYTVIDVPYPDPWHDRVKEFTGRDHDAANQMNPEYVKLSILKPLDMLEYPIFLQKSWGDSDPNREEVKRLIDDPELKTQEMDITNDLHMAVLADVFIGYPGSHYSLMIARMRYALGIKNTFVLTERKDNDWVSYIDDTNYLELYADNPWLG
jgi:hypothetical protein